MQDANGYNNGPEILNSICDKMYSDRGRGISSRSLNAMDLVEKVEEKTNIKFESTDWINSVRSINITKYDPKSYNYNGNYFDEMNTYGTLINPYLPNIY